MAAKAPVKKNLSAIKRARQAKKRNERNRALKSKVKSAIKNVEMAIMAKDKENSSVMLKNAIKTISIARSKGLLHKNNAARKISRLTRLVNTISAA